MPEKEITKKELNDLERELDKLWDKVGIDIEFTRHFFDRVNDTRNQKQITISELEDIFRKTFKKHGKKISNNVFKVKTEKEIEAILEDINTNINIPFVLQWNARKEELELISKTVMRKKNFKSSNKKFRVESFKSFLRRKNENI